MNKTYILFVTVIICLCTTFDCYSNPEDIDETDKIIQFQDSVIKNSNDSSYIYGDNDNIGILRGLSLRGAIAWLYDYLKDKPQVIVLHGETNQPYSIACSIEDPVETVKKTIEVHENYFNQYPFSLLTPDKKEITEELSKNHIVIRYRCGLPEFKTLTIKLKIYIPGSEIVHIFTYRYKLHFQTEESDKYISIEDAIADFSKEEISSLGYDTEYILDEIEYKEWTREQDNENDFWGPL